MFHVVKQKYILQLCFDALKSTLNTYHTSVSGLYNQVTNFTYKHVNDAIFFDPCFDNT